jgi:hypothetical protein
MRYIHCAISVPRKRSTLCIAIGRTVGIRESRKHQNANDKPEHILEQHSSGTELPDRHTAPTGFWMLIALSKCHSTKASSQHSVMVACLQPNTMTPFHPGLRLPKEAGTGWFSRDLLCEIRYNSTTVASSEHAVG